MSQHTINRWFGECLRKKKLKEKWADNIAKAKAEDVELHKYYCNHCQHWHITKKLKQPKPYKPMSA
jgi:hypothetical protein